MGGFGDLNIVWNPGSDKVCDTVRTALSLGYEVIALNYLVEELSVKTGKKVKDKVVAITSSQELRVQPGLLSIQDDQKQTAARQYTRFTAVISDLAQCIRLKDQVIQDYDIIAVQPTTQKVFQEACKTYNIDLISLDLSQRLDGMLVGKSAHAAVGCAITRGVHFEILYAPMLKDATARRMTIANANTLVELCRGKNIIVSSGGDKAIDLRGPYDVANLALLFGMSEEQAKHTVSTNCHSLLLHAAARKSANGVVSCVKASSLTRDEYWKISEPANELTVSEPHREKKPRLTE